MTLLLWDHRLLHVSSETLLFSTVSGSVARCETHGRPDIDSFCRHRRGRSKFVASPPNLQECFGRHTVKANFSSFPTSSWVKRSETSPATMPSVIRLRRKKTSSAWRFRDMTAPAGSHRLSSSSIGMPFISRRQDVTDVSIALRLDSSSINGLDCAVDVPELVLSLSRFLPAFE